MALSTPGIWWEPAAVDTVTLDSPKARRIGPCWVSVFYTRMNGMT